MARSACSMPAASASRVGYAGDPDRTAEQFVADPQRPGAKLYRTGDLVRRRPDGNLDFVGRHDRQVKVDGKRVELGEIEETVRRRAGVSDAVVTATKGDAGALVLTAYVKPAVAEQGPSAVAAVHMQAMQSLPSAHAAVADRGARRVPPHRQRQDRPQASWPSARPSHPCR